MSQVSIIRDNAIIPFPAGEDLTGQEGRPVMVDPNQAGDPVVLCSDSIGALPLGVLVKGGKTGETVSVAIAGGLAGTVRVKLADAVTHSGQFLKLGYLDDNLCAFARSTSSGERITMGVALEPGLADEKIEAVLFKPEYHPS